MNIFRTAACVKIDKVTFVGASAEEFAAHYAAFLAQDAAKSGTQSGTQPPAGGGPLYCEHCSRPGTGRTCSVCGTTA